jgi:hypothetical protein
MGKIKQGILGGFLGKVGGVVGGNFKGIATMRAMPLSVANPRTAAQVGNRTRFSYVTAFAAGVGLSVIQTYWNRFAVKMSGYNMFCSVNKNAFGSAGEFNVGDVAIANGSLIPPVIASAVFDKRNSTLTITGSYPISGEHLLSDLALLVATNLNGEVVFISEEFDAANISNTPYVISGVEIPQGVGSDVPVFAVSRRVDGTKVSYTSNVSAFVMA